MMSALQDIVPDAVTKVRILKMDVFVLCYNYVSEEGGCLLTNNILQFLPRFHRAHGGLAMTNIQCVRLRQRKAYSVLD